MSLTSAQICNLARIRANCPGYTQNSGLHLNLALQEIYLTGDYEVAKRAFNFTTTGAIAPIGNLVVQTASGPFQLPADYLRAKKGDIIIYWTPGFPTRLEPIDLEEFDRLVQQAGFQNVPGYWVTDTSQRRDVVTTGATTIVGSGTLSNVGNINGVAVGMGVFGDAIAPGTVTLVTAVTPGNPATVTVSPTANVIATYADPARSSLTFGVCPIAYVWPPASGAYPVLARYFSKMADIYVAENAQQIPWFEYQDFLISETEWRLKRDTSDPEWKELASGTVQERLRKYLQLKDDMSNRAHSVTLDRRRFGAGFNNLPKSKVLGY